MTIPKGGTCPVKNITPELLSRIFMFGASQDENEHDTVVLDVDESFFARRNIGLAVNVSSYPGDKTAGEDVDSGQESVGSPFPFRINVSLVSRHWRDVAVATPSLWETITIPSYPHTQPPSAHISLLLKRSLSHPINIHIGGGYRHDAYGLLTPHVHRWRSVTTDFYSHNDAAAFFRAVNHPSVSTPTRLKTLELYRTESDMDTERSPDSSPSDQHPGFRSSVPCLERLVLSGVHVDWDRAWISSASNLTFLALVFHSDNFCPSWVQFITILRGAPALKTLKLDAIDSPVEFDWIEDYFASGEMDNPKPPVQLLHLSDLSIGFAHESTFTVLLDKLDVPLLTSLHIESRDRELDNTSIIRCLTELPLALPSGATPRSLLGRLEHFKIACFPCGREEVETLYEALQNLKSFSIVLDHWVYPSSTFLNVLLSPCTLPGQDAWLPQLEKLYVSSISGYELTRRVVQERKNVGVPLKALYLEEPCGIDRESFMWFKESVETLAFFEDNEVSSKP